MNKEIYNGLNLNGNAISGIGTDDALATGGSLKYENGTLYYHNGTSWVAVSDGDVVTRTLQSTSTQEIAFNLTPAEIGTLFDDFYNGYTADKYCVLIVDLQNTVNTGLTTYAFIVKDTSHIKLSGTLVSRTMTFTNGYRAINITKVYSGSDPNTITVEQLTQTVYEEAYNFNANPKPVCVSTHPNQNGTSHFTNSVTITPRTGELKAKKVTAVDGDTDATTYTQLSPTEIKIIESEGASGEEQIIIDPRGAWKDSLKTIPAFGDMKYIGEIAEAVLPSGSTNGDVYKVTSDTEGEVFDPDAYPAGYWRTFTNSEINYIANNYRHTFGVIGEQRGFFIFPNGVETTMTMNNMVYANNTITISEWEALEAQGVVFLPFTTIWGNAIPPTSNSVKTAYWSGSIHPSDTKSAECLCWVEDNTNTTVTQLITNDDWWTTWSMAIRLVHETTSSDTTAFATAASGDIKYLKFAKSNLIYKKNIGFKFTDNAYDTYNVCGQPSETGWFDTFEYDTSGSIPSRPPWVKDTNYYHSINISGTERDWGMYNALGALTTGTFPAGTCFVNNNGELVPLGAAYTNSVYSKVSDVKIGTTTANASSVVNAASHIATLLTETAYNASTNKIATMADLDNLVYQISFSYNSLNQTDPLIPVALGTNFSDIETAYNAGKNIVFELEYDFGGTNETAYIIGDFEYIYAKAEQGSTMAITVHDSQSQPVTVNVECVMMFRKTFTDLVRFDITENISLTIYEDPTTHVTNIVAQYEIIPKNYADSSSAVSIVGDIGGYDGFDVKIDGKRIVKQINKGTITYSNDTWAISPTPSTINAGDYFTVGTAFTLTDDTLLFTGIIPAGSYTTSQHFVYDGSQWRIESVNVGNGILTTAPDEFIIKYNMMESMIDPYTPQPLGIDLSVIKAAYDAGKKLSLILYAANIYDTAENGYYEIKDFDWHYREADQGETIIVNVKISESQYTETSTDKCVTFIKELSLLGIAPETATVLIYNDLTTNTTKIQIQTDGIYSPQAFQNSAIEIPQREFGAAYLDVKRDEATISTTDTALRTISHNGTNWVYTNPSITPTQSNIVQGKYFVVAENGFTLNTDTPLFGSNVPAGTYIQNTKLFFNGSGWEIYGSSDISLRSGALYAKRMTGATANTAGTSGIVPQPMAGDNTKYLKGDGSWSAVPSYNETYTKTELLALDNTADALALYNRYVSALNEGRHCTLTVTGMETATPYSAAILTNQYILDASSHDSTNDLDKIFFKTFDRGPSSNAPASDSIIIQVYPSSAPTTAHIYFFTTTAVVNQSYTTAQQTTPLKVVLTSATTNTNGTVQYSPNITVTPSTNTLTAPKIVVSDGVYDSNNNLLTYSLSAGNGIQFTDSGSSRTITAKIDSSSLKFNGSTMYVNIDDSTIKKSVSNGKLYVPIDGNTIRINGGGSLCSDRRIYLEWYYTNSFDTGPGAAAAVLERLVATINEESWIYDRASGHTQTHIDKLMSNVYTYMLKEAYVIRYKIFQRVPAAKAPQGVLEYIGMDAGFSLVDMASGFDCRFVMAENLLTLPIKLDFHIV